MPRAIRPYIALLALLLLFWPDPASAASARRAEKPSLRLWFSAQIFYNVDPRDTVGLIKTWISLVERKANVSGDTTVTIFRTTEEARNALTDNRVDILVMIPEEYFQLCGAFPLTAVQTPDYGRHFYNELLLLVNADSGITSIGQLRGKRIRIEAGQKCIAPRQWLDTLIHSRFATDSDLFFSSITDAPKASQVITPLFFSQVDACLTNRSSYETMLELNPQLGRKIRTLNRSPGFATGVLAIRKDVSNPRRDLVLNALLDMHNDPKGRQLLTLFRINRLVPFQSEHLTSIEKLLREYRTIKEARLRKKH